MIEKEDFDEAIKTAEKIKVDCNRRLFLKIAESLEKKGNFKKAMKVVKKVPFYDRGCSIYDRLLIKINYQVR